MQRARGFTLIELIIVTIVIGIMAAVLAPLMLSSLRAYDDTLGDVVALDKLRYATERLVREIREVKYDSTTGYAFSSLVNANGNSMVFTRTYYDSNGNSLGDKIVSIDSCSAGTVTLNYSQPAKASCDGAQILTDELGSLAFTYFDENDCTSPTCTITPTNVRSVQISLTLLHNGKTYPQLTRVELKNH